MIGYKVAGGTTMSFRRSTVRKHSSDERSVRQNPLEAGMRGNSGVCMSGGACPLELATQPSRRWQRPAAFARRCCRISSRKGSGGLLSIFVMDWTSFRSTISLYMREFSLPCCVPGDRQGGFDKRFTFLNLKRLMDGYENYKFLFS